MGWLWPAQPCNLSYDRFRAGFGFADSYEQLAWRANARGETFRPSKKKILANLGHMKRLAYEEYKRGCAIEQKGGPKSKTFSDCRKVCRSKSNACGNACVSKKKKCKKLPPAEGVCSITDFQTNLDLEHAAAERWDEHRASGGAMPEEGDTSFDFAPAPIVEVPVDDSMDFGYEPPTRYGFQGLRGKHGGAAIGRGKYKPLPPGHGAIEQQRALDRIRESYIKAIESGEFELCRRGSQRAIAPVAAAPIYGNRTASEIEAVRRRIERSHG